MSNRFLFIEVDLFYMPLNLWKDKSFKCKCFSFFINCFLKYTLSEQHSELDLYFCELYITICAYLSATEM